MSHPPQPTYGRPAFTYGGPPPQQGPQYGAGGGWQGQPPPDQRIYSPPPAEQQSQYPQQNNGPAPFYFIPPSQQQNQAPARTPSNPNVSSDDLYAGAPPRTNINAGRPHSMAFDPRMGGGPGTVGAGVSHELATGSFDSPVDNRQSYIGQPSQPPQGVPAPLQQAPEYEYAGRPESPYAQEQQAPPQQVVGGLLKPSTPYTQPNHSLSSLPSQQGRLPLHPSAPPPSVPQNAGSPVYPPFGAAYQAYQPVTAPTGSAPGGAPPGQGATWNQQGPPAVGAGGAREPEGSGEGFYR
jgi:signal transducing adaptor molecule